MQHNEIIAIAERKFKVFKTDGLIPYNASDIKLEHIQLTYIMINFENKTIQFIKSFLRKTVKFVERVIEHPLYRYMLKIQWKPDYMMPARVREVSVTYSDTAEHDDIQASSVKKCLDKYIKEHKNINTSKVPNKL